MTQLTEETATPPATTDAEPVRRHCWECLRRRLVCDSTRPVCNRCRTNKIVCPGYGEQQPLRWVKPGRVTARNRRRTKAETAAQQGTTRASKKVSDETGGDGDVVNAETAVSQTTPTSWDSSDDGELQSKFSAMSLFSIMQPKLVDSIMRHDIACENFAGLQASYDYNIEIYERSSPLPLLIGDSRIKLPMAAVARYLPTPIRGLFILFAIAHQLHKLPRDAEENIYLQARSAIAFWSCQVIRSLNQDIAEESTRVTDGTMTGVLMLMMADQQVQPSTRWRFHYNGLMKMVRLRGGIKRIWDESPHMQSVILTWVLGEVFANTTSPSHDQLTELTHPKNLEFLQEAWSRIPEVYIGSICPPSLFATIIRINHLRALAARGIATSYSSTTTITTTTTSPSTSSSPSPSSASEDDLPVYTDAQTLLDRLLDFSPPLYASANSTPTTQANWLLVARIYQSSAVLFCILSLQHVLLLPESLELSRLRSTHYDRLLLDLREGFRHVNFKNCFFWPLVVAAAAAARGSAFERAFLADLMSDSVADMGSSMPLLARRVMVAFWDSGKSGWDDCFDQPYLFIM
ncbi:fungal-specific transcription factor domain-containing protein [Xylaria cf. heliscus]|nr:fungal-specific transcription factor domain-containing protein [Xylaria cf. heliscus]